MPSDVLTTLAGWLSTSASNQPQGTTSVSTNLDDSLREIQGVVVRGLSHKGADIASAATTDIGAVEGLAHDITGTTTITAFGTVRAGIWKILKFEGALTLTHNATSLILPGGANITTADGDIAILMSEGSGNWRCVSYFKAASLYITASSTDTLTNKTLTAPALNGALSGDAIAAQAEMESGTATDSIVSPGRQHFHPSAAKAWCRANNAGAAVASYNVTSVTDTGTGDATVNWSITFSAATAYCVVGAVHTTSTLMLRVNSLAAANSTQLVVFSLAGALADPDSYMVAAFGDL